MAGTLSVYAGGYNSSKAHASRHPRLLQMPQLRRSHTGLLRPADRRGRNVGAKQLEHVNLVPQMVNLEARLMPESSDRIAVYPALGN